MDLNSIISKSWFKTVAMIVLLTFIANDPSFALQQGVFRQVNNTLAPFAKLGSSLPEQELAEAYAGLNMLHMTGEILGKENMQKRVALLY